MIREVAVAGLAPGPGAAAAELALDAGAEVVGVRAEQVAAFLSQMAPDERDRLATILTSGTRSYDQSESDTFSLAEELRVTRPSLGVVMVRRRIDTAVLSDAIRSGVREVVQALVEVAEGRSSEVDDLDGRLTRRGDAHNPRFPGL